MNKTRIILPVIGLLFSLFFLSCSKTGGSGNNTGGSGGSGGGGASGSGILLKNLITVAIDPATGAETDSVDATYTYDNQNRSTAILRVQYDQTTKKLSVKDSSTYAYAQRSVVLTDQQWTSGGAQSLTVTTYYLNAAGTLADSSTIVITSSAAPTKKTSQSYSYDGNGYLIQQNNYDLTSGQPVLNSRTLSTISGGNTIMTVDTLVNASFIPGQSVQFYDTLRYTMSTQSVASIKATISDYIGSNGILGRPDVNLIQSFSQLGIVISLNYTFDSQNRLSMVTDNLGGTTKYATSYYTYY